MTMDGDRWMSAKAAERRARTTYRYRTDAGALREAWRDEAARHGWAPADWWTPGVDAVTRALVEGRAIEPSCDQLGRERAEAGHGIRTALDDLDALYRLLPPGAPPADAVHAVAEAWAAVVMAPIRVTFCPDFATAAHLRARAAEMYRQPPPTDLAVLVVDVAEPDGGSGWEAVALLLEIGARVPAAFPPDARVARLSPGRLVTLVRQEAVDAFRELLDEADVRVADLPADLPAASRMADRVSAGTWGTNR
jgi:hypothetical protein